MGNVLLPSATCWFPKYIVGAGEHSRVSRRRNIGAAVAKDRIIGIGRIGEFLAQKAFLVQELLLYRVMNRSLRSIHVADYDINTNDVRESCTHPVAYFPLSLISKNRH